MSTSPIPSGCPAAVCSRDGLSSSRSADLTRASSSTTKTWTYVPGLALRVTRFDMSRRRSRQGGRSAPRTGLYAVLARSRMRYARLHADSVSANLQRLGFATGALTHVIANADRPAHRRGHIAALIAIVRPAR